MHEGSTVCLGGSYVARHGLSMANYMADGRTTVSDRLCPVAAYVHACVRLKRTLRLLANTYYMQFTKMAALCVPNLTVVVCRMLLLVQDCTGAPVWALLSCRFLRPPWPMQCKLKEKKAICCYNPKLTLLQL
jgi:hypothetical protein